MTRRIDVVIFPGFQILDATGPIAVFEIAGRHSPGAYDLRVTAAEPGATPSSAGVALAAESLSAERVDTVVLAGGDGTYQAAVCPRLRAWLLTASETARRTASICSGA